MGMGAFHRDIIQASRQDIGGRIHTADIGCSGSHGRPLRTVGPSQTKVDHLITLGRKPNPGPFGCDEGLEVHHIQECGFNELGLR